MTALYWFFFSLTLFAVSWGAIAGGRYLIREYPLLGGRELSEEEKNRLIKWTGTGLIFLGVLLFALLCFDFGKEHDLTLKTIIVCVLVYVGFELARKDLFPGDGIKKVVRWSAVIIMTVAIVRALLVWIAIPYLMENPMRATAWIVDSYKYLTSPPTPDTPASVTATAVKPEPAMLIAKAPRVALPPKLVELPEDGTKIKVAIGDVRWKFQSVGKAGCFGAEMTSKEISWALFCHEGEDPNSPWPFGGKTPEKNTGIIDVNGVSEVEFSSMSGRKILIMIEYL